MTKTSFADGDAADLLAQASWRLRSLADWGVQTVPLGPEARRIVQRWRQGGGRTPHPRPRSRAAGGTPAPARPTLEQVRAELGDCRRCALCRQRTQIVFGEGAPDAELVFVGEGPGLEEDRSGRPFVGPAGRLLDRIIAAMKLDRSRVYIANVVKCRPPGNRNPAPEEIAACLPFLRGQLRAIGPRVVCTLGSVATRALLQTDAPVSSLRGRFHPFGSIRLMPTFHPAYLLRNPEAKRHTWHDVQKIMAFLGIAT